MPFAAFVVANARLKWSCARKRYERQGLLVEEAALERAEQECLADAEVRALCQDLKRPAALNRTRNISSALRPGWLYPACPAGRELEIARHVCEKYSGRVGRGASAKSLDEKSVRLAVMAHVRHAGTRYGELLAQGRGCSRARQFGYIGLSGGCVKSLPRGFFLYLLNILGREAPS